MFEPGYKARLLNADFLGKQKPRLLKDERDIIFFLHFFPFGFVIVQVSFAKISLTQSFD